MSAHPGTILKELIDTSGITYTEFAKRIGVSTTTVSRIINGKQNITADTAIRISKAFDEFSPEQWMSFQNDHDISVCLSQFSYERILPL